MPLLDHHPGTAAGLLGGLEDQRNATREIAGLGQVARGAQQHGGVPVMAAGMHPAGIARGMGQPGLLEDRQPVHVGAQPDGRPRRAAVDDRHDAGAGDALVQLVDAERAQPLGHEGGGFGTVEPQFRDLVQMPAPSGHVAGKIGDAVDDGMGWTPGPGSGIDACDTR